MWALQGQMPTLCVEQVETVASNIAELLPLQQKKPLLYNLLFKKKN